MSYRIRKLMVTGAILAGIGAVVVFVGRLVDAQEGTGPPASHALQPIPTAPSYGKIEEILGLDLGSPLFTRNRTHLSLCVDGVAGFPVSEDNLGTVRRALDEALGQASAVPPEYGDPTVVLGCPPAGAVTGSRVADDEDWRGSVRVGPGGSRDPSPHLLFVYFVAPEAYASSFGDRDYFRAMAELVCHVDVCIGGVTSAVYVPSSVTEDVLSKALLDGLGLDTVSGADQTDEIV